MQLLWMKIIIDVGVGRGLITEQRIYDHLKLKTRKPHTMDAPLLGRPFIIDISILSAYFIVSLTTLIYFGPAVFGLHFTR